MLRSFIRFPAAFILLCPLAAQATIASYTTATAWQAAVTSGSQTNISLSSLPGNDTFVSSAAVSGVTFSGNLQECSGSFPSSCTGSGGTTYLIGSNSITVTPPSNVNVSAVGGDFAAYYGNSPQNLSITATTFSGASLNVNINPGNSISFVGFVSSDSTDPIQNVVFTEVGNSKNYAALMDFSYFSSAYSALSISTASLPDGVTGAPYTFSMTGRGGSGQYSWSASGLPSVLSINSSGAITGTPSSAGTSSNVQVTLTDTRAGGSVGPQTFALTILQSTTTTLTSSANPASVGQAITLTATVAPTSGVNNPGGNVQFKNGGTVIATVPLSSGAATTTFNPGATGSYSLTAVYEGDTNDSVSNSVTLTQAVEPATTTALTSSANPANAGQSVTFTATVTPSTASGTVTFKDSGTSIGTGTLASGVATLTTSSLSPGAHSIVAAYAGDGSDGPSSSTTLTETVKPATATSLTVSPQTSTTLGTLVTLTATVSPSVTGKVTFYSGTQVLGTRTLAGSSATLTTRLLPAGNNVLFARYVGNAASSSSVSTIAPATNLLVHSRPQGGFNSGTAYSLGASGAWGTATADFNNDGIADLVVANYNDSLPSIDVFLGKGDGTFNTGMGYTVSNGPIAVATGDFNGDGFTDIAVADYDSGAVSILINNQSGGFNAPVDYTAGIGTQPESIAVADFNGDGYPDLAVANNGSNNMSILFGTGTGTFGAGTLYNTGFKPGSIVAADFDGDGKPDLATGNFGNADIPGSITVYFNQGAGVFGAPVAYQTGGRGTYSIAAGDFNADGLPDLATANSSSNNVSVLLNNSSNTPGVFGTASTYFDGNAVFPASIAIGDFNGDGYLDLAAGNDGSNNFSVFFGDGSGGFGALGDYPFQTTAGARGLAVADFNGDGISDIAVSNFGTPALSVILGTIPTTTTLSSNENPSTYGDGVNLTATIVPSNATGTVTFYDNATILGTATVSSGAASFPTSTLIAGSHAITTFYTGDNTYGGGTGSGLTQTVNQVGTNVSATPTLTGQNLSVAVTVIPLTGKNAPTGTVSLYDQYQNLLTSGTLDGKGQATLTAYLSTGNQTVTVVYAGDTNNTTSSTSFPLDPVSPTSIYLNSSANPGSSAEPIILTASVSPGGGYARTGTPKQRGALLPHFNSGGATGTITFYDNGTPLGTGPITIMCCSSASLSVSLAAGTHSLTAVYSGDSNNAGATSPVLTESVLPGAAVTLNLNKSSILFGSQVTLSGSVTPTAATGFLSFYDGVTYLGAGPVANGLASLKTTFINLGNRSVTAYYSGDANNGASTSAPVSIAVASAPQNGFGTVVPYAVGTNTYASAVGDFNRDGIEDLAVTTYGVGGSFISILIGNGGGTFQTALNRDFPDQPTAIAVADLNRDGIQDLVVGAGNGVYTLLGNSDGTFQAASSAYGYGPIDSVAIADFNGDGLPDVIAGITSGGLIPLLGDGTGSLAEQGIGGVLAHGAVVAVADFNRDGNADFVAADNSGNVDIYLGNSDGTFQQPALYYSTGTPITVAAADLNHDGYPDVVVSNNGGGIWVFLNQGNGTLGSPVEWKVGTEPYVVVTGDFNGDGFVDIAVGDNTGIVNIMPGVGDGTFPTATPYTVSNPVYSLAVGNFTGGSGRGDLLVTYGSSGGVGVLVSALTPTSVGLTSSVNPTTFGQNTTLTATVTPSTATGTVTFTDGEGRTPIGTGTLNGSGVATLTLNTLIAGSHLLGSTYGGDANNATSNSNNITQAVNQTATGLTLTSSLNPSPDGQSVTFTATITPSGAPATGTVTFLDGPTPIGTGTVSGNVATFATTALAVAAHSISASYPGDANVLGSTSNTVSQVVNLIATSTALTSSVNPTTFGQSTTLTARVSPATAAGTVTLNDGGSPIGSPVTLTSGVATYPISSLSATSHSLTAVYNGSTSYATSTSPVVTQVVNPLPIITSIVGAPDGSSPPLAPGGLASINGTTLAPSSQTASGTPWLTSLNSVSVTVNNVAVPLGSVSATSITFQIPYETAPGTYPVVVTNGSLVSNTFNLSVAAAAPALYSRILNQGGATNASGSGAIAGTTVLVNFTGLGVVTPAVADGAAAPASPLSASAFTVTGTVNGAAATVGNVFLAPATVGQAQANVTIPANLTTGSYPLALTVNGVTSQPAAIYVTTPPALSITTSSPLPTGSVGSAYSTTLAATGGSGIAANYQWTSSTLPSGLSIGLNTGTISGTPLAAGNYSSVSITVTDTATGQSTPQTFAITIGKSSTSTALISSLNPSTFGASVTLTATVTGSSPTGTVTFLDGATSIGTGTLSGGVYALVINNLSVATHSITAAYNGDANNYTSTSSAVSQVVNQAPTSITLTSSLNPSISGDSVTFTASGLPTSATGTITFNDGGSGIGTGTLGGGSATLTVSNLSIASHSVTAVYGGDTNDVGSTSATLTQVVNPIPNLVINGDFETAIPGGGGIPGWSRADNANGSTESQFDNAATGCGIGGSQCAQLGAGGLGATISQTLSTTPGQIYQLIYFLNAAPAGQPNAFSVIWDGSPVTGLPLVNAPSAPYQQYTATVVASTASTVFSISAAAGGIWYLDNVSVKAATGLPLITAISPATGFASGGTAVTLTGQNFTGATSVTFGGVAATGVAVINGGTGITVNSPATVAGLVDVTVTTPAGNNGGSTAFTYQPVGTTTTLSGTPNPSQSGQSVTFTATVTTGATGTVSFYQNVSNLLGTATLTGGNPNIAIFALNYLPAGTDSVSATYGGDTTYGTSSSNTISQIVNNTSSTALTSSLNPSTFGAPVTFTATVTPRTATGTVTFLDGSTTLGTGTLTSGVATFSTKALTAAASPYSVTAVYGGDTNDLTSTSSVLTQTVTPASQSITFNSLGNQVFGTAPFTIAASATSGLPVSFSTSSLIDVQFGCTAGSSCVTGVSSLPQVGPAVVGNAGDTWNLVSGVSGLGATGTNVSLTDTYGNATPVTVSWNSDLLFETGAGNGAFGGTPYANLFGGYLVNVSSTPKYITINGLAPGTAYSLYMYTQGDTAAAGRETQFIVNGGTPVITNAGADIGTFVNNQNYVLINAVSDNTGALSIAYSAASGEADIEGLQLLTGSTACSVSGAMVTLLSAGACTIQAAQAGNTNYLAATPVSQGFSITPTPTSTALTSSLNPSAFGQSVTLTAKVLPASAGGTITFKDGSTMLGTVTMASGSATLTTATLSVGAHSITAVYSGDTNDLTSTAEALTETINQASSTTTLTSQNNPGILGQTVTLNVSVSPATATGTVTLNDGGSPIGSPVTLTSGAAAFTTSSLALGPHSLTVSYSGDVNYQASVSVALTQNINQVPTITSLNTSANPSIAGHAITLTASVTPATATGTITFNDGSTPLGSAVTLSNGTAQFVTSTLTPGAHSLNAVYSGDANNLGSNSTLIGSPLNLSVATPGTVPDSSGQGTGFTGRLSGTGSSYTGNDPNLTLNTDAGTLTINSTPADLDGQNNLPAAEYLAIPLSSADIGATDDFAVSAGFNNVQYSQSADQFGLFVGTGSAQTFRVGALFSGAASAYDVQNSNGTDTNLQQSTALAPLPGDNVTFTLSRTGGTWAFNVVNATNPSRSGSVPVTQPTYLNGLSNLVAGVYAANPGNGAPKTETLSSFFIGAPVQTVVANTTTTSLSSSSNPAVVGQGLAFTATVAPSTATGTVTFFDGATSLGSANLTAASAVFSASLTTGIHTITATYNGDTNDLTSSSPALTQSITYPPLTINTSSVPAGQSGVAYGPVSFSATGGSGNFNWTASGLPNGLGLGSGGTLSGTPVGGFNGTLSVTVRDTLSGGSATQSYSLVITSVLSITGPSSLGSVLAGKPVSGSFTASGGTPPYTWTVSGGFNVDGNGNVTGTAGGPGNYSVTLTVTDSAKATASLGLSYSSFGITTTSLPSANTTSNYSAAITAAGGTPPYTITASGLPPGLTVSSGSIGGRATTPGTYPVSVQVGDSQGLSATASFSIIVTGSTALTVTSSSLANGTVGQPYSQALSANGGSPGYTWTQSGGVMPAGLSLNGSGTVSGVPTTPGTYSVGVQATDTVGGQAAGTVSIVIQPAPLTITSGASLPSGIVNSAYPAQILTASGGVPPYTFTITGSLPDGLTLANGQIGGTPTAAGSFGFTVVATDSAAPPVTGSLGVSAVIRGPAPDLVLSAATTTFSLTAGTSAAPSASSVTVSSSDSSQTLDFSIGGSSASWLSVTGGTSTPASLSIGLTPAALTLTSAGSPYSGSVTLTCSSSVCAGKSQTVNVTLTVTDAPPQLTVGSQLLSFVAQAPNPQASSTTVAIQNTGGGSLKVASVTAADNWISVGSFPGAIPPGPGASVSITVNPAALPPGFYTSSISISTSAGSAEVPVSLLISANSTMSLGPAGAQFSMPQGGALGSASGSFLVSISSASPVNYTATVLPGASWLVGGGTGSASGTGPGTVTYSLDQTQLANFAPGAYYGTIEVAASGAVNTPQDYQVVLNISPASTPVVPDPEPAGLVFLSSTAGPLPPQNIHVLASSKTPLSYQASAATSSGGNWLSISGGTGSAVAGAPGTVLASVDSTGLKPGVYRGTVSFASGPSVRTVNVTLVVETPATAPHSAISGLHPNAAGPICAGGQLAPTQTGLVSNFSAPASWPTPMAITLVDTCGTLIGSGQIIATFSNGDPPLQLALVNAAQGLYSGTWTPRKTSSQTTITAHVSASGYSATTVQIAGQVTPNAAPSLAPNGALDVFHPQVGAGLGPGNIVQIYGSALSSQAVSATTLPLPTTVNGTQVLIGGIQSPLFYVSPGQVNAQIPFELQAGQQYQVIVSANGALTTPQPIQLNAGTPAMLQFTSGLIVAQHQDASLVSTDSPAVPGEYLTLYMSGLGATDIPVPSGQASPTSPLANVLDVPTLTINGTQVPLLFAGLTPGLVGLYQIDIQVPAGLPSGTYNVAVSQDGVASNTTLLPVAGAAN